MTKNSETVFQTTINNNIKVLHEKIEALESRNAFQDDVIEQLNSALAVYQHELSEMKFQVTLLASRVKDAANGSGISEEAEAPPPHY